MFRELQKISGRIDELQIDIWVSVLNNPKTLNAHIDLIHLLPISMTWKSLLQLFIEIHHYYSYLVWALNLKFGKNGLKWLILYFLFWFNFCFWSKAYISISYRVGNVTFLKNTSGRSVTLQIIRYGFKSYFLDSFVLENIEKMGFL